MNPTILTLEQAILRFAREKRNARRIVFAHGSFDLLHPGHIRGLEAARGLGDALVIGLYSDAAVRQSKGESRPVIPEDERAEILAALECVDAVVLLRGATPEEAIERLLPDVVVGRSDARAQIARREKMGAVGGRVVTLPVVPEHSTSAILKKIRDGARASRAKS